MCWHGHKNIKKCFSLHRWNANTIQIRHRGPLWSFSQTLLSNCLSFSQESVCSMWSQLMLSSLVSILQSDPLSDWSICSRFESCWGTLLLVEDNDDDDDDVDEWRNCPSESTGVPPSPEAHTTDSFAWRIQLSHCCLLKVSFACSEWDWLWDPLLKLTLKKFLTERNQVVVFVFSISIVS